VFVTLTIFVTLVEGCGSVKMMPMHWNM